MAQLISNRYSKALFDLAKESNKLDEFENQVRTIYEVLNSEREFMQILEHPHILADEKVSLLQKVFSSKILDEIMGLLVLVMQKNRQEYLLEILNTFLENVKEYKGIVTATVISAVPLNREQVDQIKQKLENNLQKQIQIKTQVDQSLIGGLKVRVGDRVLDSSIEGKLHSLKTSLYDLQLA